MNSVKAAQPEIIRSHQKDEFFQVNLRNEVSRIVIDWFGKFVAKLLLQFLKVFEVL